MTKKELLNVKNKRPIDAKSAQKRCFFAVCMIFALVCVLFCGINVQNINERQVFADIRDAQNANESTYTISNLTKLRQNGENLYLIDSAMNALIFGTADDIRAGSAKVITSRYVVSEGNITEVVPFEALRDVAVLQDGTILLIDSRADYIHEYSADTGEFKKLNYSFENGQAIANIIAIDSDYNDTVFALQKQDGYRILKRDVDDTYFSVAFELPYATITELGATYDADAKIVCSFENETIYIVGGGAILKVALSDATPVAVSFASYSGTCQDVAMDYLGYPYLVLDDKIIRFDENQVSLALSTKSCAFNCENGVITYIKDAQNFATYTSDFVNNLSRFQHEVDFSASESLSVGAEIYKVNLGVGASAYKYPFKIIKLGQLNLNAMVIKLTDVAERPAYAYVLANIDGKMTACYINKDSLTKVTDENAVSGDYYTFTANTKLFKYPTADIINEKTPIVLKRVPSGTKLEVQSGVCDYTDAQEREFYQVKYDEKIYYVMRALVTDDATVATSSLQLKANNAHLKGHTSAQVYDGIDGGTVIGEIAVGAKFYVNAKTFDKTSDYTYVEYLDENNNYICGFVATSAISLDLVSPLFILAIFLIIIVAILVLILVLYFISRSSKEKKDATEAES